jgi:hypothetical protein
MRLSGRDGGNSLKAGHGNGVVRWLMVPSPSRPLSFDPHAQTVPSDFRATVWKSPAATAETAESPATCAGMERLVVAPSPSCPLAFDPHAQTVPSDFSAIV